MRGYPLNSKGKERVSKGEHARLTALPAYQRRLSTECQKRRNTLANVAQRSGTS